MQNRTSKKEKQNINYERKEKEQRACSLSPRPPPYPGQNKIIVKQNNNNTLNQITSAYDRLSDQMQQLS